MHKILSSEEILKGNKLIAEFDDKKKDIDSPWYRGFDIMIHGQPSSHEESMKYHSSWDWQIPVYAKCDIFFRDKKEEAEKLWVNEDLSLWKSEYTKAIRVNNIEHAFKMLVNMVTLINQMNSLTSPVGDKEK